MFDAGADVPALDPFDEGCRHLAGQVGIFGVILEIAAAEGRPLDIDSRAQNDAQLFVLAAVTDLFAHTADQVPVKGRGGSACCGETDRLDAVIHSQMVAFLVLLPQTVRAVTDHDGRNVEPLHGFGVPEVEAGTQPGFLFQSHFGNERTDVHFPSFCKDADASAIGRIRVFSTCRSVICYSLTPPRATPAMMYLLKAKYTMIRGRAVMVRPR